MTINHDAAKAYIRRLRKHSKRAFAEQYWSFLIQQLVSKNYHSEPPQPSNLGAMGAQAVRMNLHSCIDHLV